jgi:hypothetical protein
MNQSSRVIGMKMRQYDLAHVSGSYSEGSELGADLFVRMDGKADRALIERMPGGMVSGLMNARDLSRIYHNDSLIMLDDPRVNRKPLRPVLVEQHVCGPGKPCTARFRLRTPHLHQACANCVDCWHLLLLFTRLAKLA